MKYLKYLKRILCHKWFVFLECCKVGRPIAGLTHDLSKFLPSQFIAYTNYFYGKKNHKEGSEYENAWLHHMHDNPHHWQYWIMPSPTGNIVYPMPKRYIEEMVCDWMAVSRAEGKLSRNKFEWFDANRDKMQLHYNTITLIAETLIKMGDKN